MYLLVLYDISSDRLRKRVADACLDFNLQPIQYSAFLGPVDPAWRPELEERLHAILGDAPGRIHIVPLSRDARRRITALDNMEKPK